MSYYNKEEQEVINDWLVSVGAPYLANEDLLRKEIRNHDKLRIN